MFHSNPPNAQCQWHLAIANGIGHWHCPPMALAIKALTQRLQALLRVVLSSALSLLN